MVGVWGMAQCVCHKDRMGCSVVKSLGTAVLEEREQLGGCCRNPGEGWDGIMELGTVTEEGVPYR